MKIFGQSLGKLPLHEGENVPLILVMLCEQVIRTGGLTTEGIFRQSPAQTEFVETKRLLEDYGQITTEMTKNPHVYASLVKHWLGQLPKPLLEDRYIKIVEQQKELSEVFPALNFRVLRYLSRFFLKFLSPQAQTKNRLTIENTSILLTPGLFQPRSRENFPAKLNFVQFILANLSDCKTLSETIEEEFPDLTQSIYTQVVQQAKSSTKDEARIFIQEATEQREKFREELVEDVQHQLPIFSKEEIRVVLSEKNWELGAAVDVLLNTDKLTGSGMNQGGDEPDTILTSNISMVIEKDTIRPGGSIPISFEMQSGEVHADDIIAVCHLNSSETVDSQKVLPNVDPSKPIVQGSLKLKAPQFFGKMQVKFLRGEECLSSANIQIGPSFELSIERRDDKIVVNCKQTKGQSYYFAWVGIFEKNAENSKYIESSWCHSLLYGEYVEHAFKVPPPGEYEIRVFPENEKCAAKTTVHID